MQISYLNSSLSDLFIQNVPNYKFHILDWIQWFSLHFLHCRIMRPYFYGSAWACKNILIQIQEIGFTPVWSVVVDCFCRSGLIYGQLYLFCCGCTWSHSVNQCSCCWLRSSFNHEVLFWAQRSYYYPTSPFPAYTNSHALKCVKDPVSLLHVRNQKAEAAHMAVKHETGRTDWISGWII